MYSLQVKQGGNQPGADSKLYTVFVRVATTVQYNVLYFQLAKLNSAMYVGLSYDTVIHHLV